MMTIERPDTTRHAAARRMAEEVLSLGDYSATAWTQLVHATPELSEGDLSLALAAMAAADVLRRRRLQVTQPAA